VACPAAVFVILMLLYIFTLSPTVNFNDSGELITAAHTFGIAHPTGYPFYTTAGRLAALVFPGSPAYRINLLSAVFAALTGAFIALTVLLVNRRLRFYSGTLNNIFSLSAGLIAGCSQTLWQHATNAEVYSITSFFYSAIILILFLWLTASRENQSTEQKIFLIGAYCVGLAFTNHMSAMHIFPAVIIMLAVERKWLQYKPIVLAAGVIAAFIAVTWYLALPIRARLSPFMNWGDPHSFHNFLMHISGKQYQIWMFSLSPGEITQNFKYFAALLWNQYSPIVHISAAAGLIVLLRRNYKFAVILLTICVSNIAYSVNYSIPDIDAYFLPTFLIVYILSAVGLASLSVWIPRKIWNSLRIPGQIKSVLPVILIAIALLHTVSGNVHKTSMRNNRQAEIMAKDLFKSVEPDALVLLKRWDLYTIMLYFRKNEQHRPDVLLIDQRLLRRSWYVEGLLLHFPNDFREAGDAMRAFLRAVYPFEHGQTFDSNFIQRRFAAMIDAIIDSNFQRRAVYIDLKETPEIAASYTLTPENLLYRLQKGIIQPVSDWKLDTSITQYTGFISEREATIINIYSAMAAESGRFALMAHDTTGAVNAFRHSLEYNQKNHIARYNLAAALMLRNDLEAATREIHLVLAGQPENRLARSLLEEIEKRSAKNK